MSAWLLAHMLRHLSDRPWLYLDEIAREVNLESRRRPDIDGKSYPPQYFRAQLARVRLDDEADDVRQGGRALLRDAAVDVLARARRRTEVIFFSTLFFCSMFQNAVRNRETEG